MSRRAKIATDTRLKRARKHYRGGWHVCPINTCLIKGAGRHDGETPPPLNGQTGHDAMASFFVLTCNPLISCHVDRHGLILSGVSNYHCFFPRSGTNKDCVEFGTTKKSVALETVTKTALRNWEALQIESRCVSISAIECQKGRILEDVVMEESRRPQDRVPRRLQGDLRNSLSFRALL